jgi:hypothetical protein
MKPRFRRLHPHRADGRGRDHRHPRGDRDPHLLGLHGSRQGDGPREQRRDLQDRRAGVLQLQGFHAGFRDGSGLHRGRHGESPPPPAVAPGGIITVTALGQLSVQLVAAGSGTTLNFNPTCSGVACASNGSSGKITRLGLQDRLAASWPNSCPRPAGPERERCRKSSHLARGRSRRPRPGSDWAYVRAWVVPAGDLPCPKP